MYILFAAYVMICFAIKQTLHGKPNIFTADFLMRNKFNNGNAFDDRRNTKRN